MTRRCAPECTVVGREAAAGHGVGRDLAGCAFDAGELLVRELGAPFGVEVADPARLSLARLNRGAVLELRTFGARRGSTVRRAEVVVESFVGRHHLTPPRRPARHDRVGDADDLAHRDPFLGSRRLPFDSETIREFAFECRPVEGAGGVRVSVDRLRVGGSPRTVVPLDAIEDGAVSVELRVADAFVGRGRSCGSVSKFRDGEAGRLRSTEPSGTGSGVARRCFEVVESGGNGGIVGGRDD